jgi:F0F1-type ATP synthase membrane subunit b/b'
MPQLDKVTFFSQLFWLFLFFLSFYGITASVILPKIAKIIKIRKKKIVFNNNKTAILKYEEELVKFFYENHLMNTLTASRKILTNTIKSSLNWFNDSIKKTNESLLLDFNKKYLKNIVDIDCKKRLIEYIIRS